MKIAQEANLQAIIAHFDGYLWSMDIDRHYIILNTTVTEKIKELTGLDVKPGDAIQDFPGLMEPSMTPVWEKICGLGFKGESVRMIREFRIKGQPAFFELSVIPIRKGQEVPGISCFIKDLTTETLTGHHLQTSEKRFRSLIENGADIIVVVDGEGKIVYGSPSIEHYFGVTDAENLGKNAFEYVHQGDLSRLAETFMDVLGEPGRTVTVEARAVLKDNAVIWVEGAVTNLLASEGIGVNDIINRAEVFRGHVTLDTAPGKGCSLSVLFPLPAAENKIFAIEKNSWHAD